MAVPGPELSVVIPAYNEEMRLGKTLAECFAYLRAKRLKSELIVVDDGSSDGTLEVAESFKKRAPKAVSFKILPQGANRGKGAAVKTGALVAKGTIVLYMDADNATPLSEYGKFGRLFAQGAEVVVGSRAVDRSQVKIRQPFYRIAIGRLGNVLIQVLAVPGIHDTQCGFKAFTRKAAQAVFSLQTIERFAFDVEVLYIARKLGFSIVETSVVWFDMPGSKVNAVRDSLRTFGEVLRIRSNDLKGRYGSSIEGRIN